MDSNAVITLEALVDHPDFAFTVTVLTQKGTATREHSLVLLVHLCNVAEYVNSCSNSGTVKLQYSSMGALYLSSSLFKYIFHNTTNNSFALTGDSDYKGERFTVTFPAGVNVISFNVTITDDNIAELAELFTLDLEIPAASADIGVIKGSPDTATVSIMDNEG